MPINKPEREYRAKFAAWKKIESDIYSFIRDVRDRPAVRAFALDRMAEMIDAELELIHQEERMKYVTETKAAVRKSLFPAVFIEPETSIQTIDDVYNELVKNELDLADLRLAEQCVRMTINEYETGRNHMPAEYALLAKINALIKVLEAGEPDDEEEQEIE